MSAANSQGIQTLLEAERKAQQIVQEARAYRTQRIKASKADAQKEVEEYKAKKEAELAESTKNNKQTDDQAEQIASEKAKELIAELEKQGNEHRAEVIKFLVSEASLSS